nr:sigma-54-dependent Fis family transcriptional regulator [Bacillus piscicola]
MSEREVPQSNKVRVEVLESWKRCQQYGVDPLQKQTLIKVREDKLKEQINQSALYNASLPIIENFSKQIAGTNHLITLGDQEGKIICLKGETPILDKAEQMNFVIGADWSEKSAGSNAIGTSLASRKPIQILSSEHYCQGVHPWVCSSAPIRDPRTNNILGIIDLTGPSHHAQSHSLSVVQNVSYLIEQQLFIHSYDVFKHLQDTYQEMKTNTSAHVVILDEMLHVVHGDSACLDLFSLSHWTQLWEKEEISSLKRVLLAKKPYELEWEVASFPSKIRVRRITFNAEHIGFALFIEKTGLSAPPNTKLKGVIGQSAALKQAVQKIGVISDKNIPVLLTGVSGTGKEVFAHNIHLKSERKHNPFIAINCGAIPENLITSELFGYARGAFTGGDPQGKKGKFEEANGGTVFLDEIGEMPLDLQVHLLRVLQEKEVVPVGSAKPVPIDVRIIAATNQDLESLIQKGAFRADLYYRLNVVEVHLPPLKNRKGDIPLLCQHFAKELANRHGREVPAISQDVLALFEEYSWPGNIREMKNVMEYAILFHGGHCITLESLPKYILEKQNEFDTYTADRLTPLERAEREEIIELIHATNGNLSEVARRCQIARTTLYRRMKKYEIDVMKKV